MAGADTIAPKTPDTVAVVKVSDTSCIVSWSASNTNEEIGGALTDLAGYRIYRSPSANPSDWGDSIAQVNSATLQYFDSGFTRSDYYYKITAFDAKTPYPNESWYSDSTAYFKGFPDYSGPIWYINANFGSDAGGNGSETYPFKNAQTAMTKAHSGDTILLAAGTYTQKITVETNNISIIGADSAATIIDLSDSTVEANIGISADTKTNILIKNIQLKNCFYGVRFRNTDTSTIDNVTAYMCGIVKTINNIGGGVAMLDGSDSNTLSNSYFSKNFYGVFFKDSARNLISNNTGYNNDGECFYGETVSYCIISGNTASYNKFHVFSINYSNNNILTNNQCFFNSKIDYNIIGGSNNSLISNSGYNNTSGYECFSIIAENNFTLQSNISSNNSGIGFIINKCNNGIIVQNTSSNNNTGFQFGYSDNNRVINNISSNNTSFGFYIDASSNNYFTLNSAIANNDFGFYISRTSSADTFVKNNWISSSPTNKAVGNATGGDTIFDFRNNYWSTSDSMAVAGKISGSGSDKIVWSPFRFGAVDTSAGADTIAPKAPDTVAIVSTGDTSCIISWSASNANEEIGGALTDLLGYKIYKKSASLTTDWFYLIAQVDSNILQYADSGVAIGDSYYYRITAIDNKSVYPNESWYSDSWAIFTTKTLPQYSGPVWYVNANTGIDGGAGNGSETYPYKSIGYAMNKASAGETIMIAAGTYTEAVVIDKNNIALIGADSSTTIIDPPGNYTASNLYGIYANAKTYLRVSGLRITDCNYGIYFLNVDYSVIDNVQADSSLSSGRAGIYLYTGCESNTVSNCYLYNNNYGVYLQSNTAKYNTISNNIIANNITGIYLNQSNLNILRNNAIRGNSSGSLYLAAAPSNTIAENSVYENGMGINLIMSNSNIFSDNRILNNNNFGFSIRQSSSNQFYGNISKNNNGYGFYIYQTSPNNIFRYNESSSNYGSLGYGFYINASVNNAFYQNTVDSNAQYGIYISSGNGSVFGQNNFAGGADNSDSIVINYTNSDLNFTNNYWSTTDSAAISNKIKGTYPNKVLWQPFRLTIVDTAAGADTIAPATPSNLSFDTSAGPVVLSWTKPTLDENGGALSGLNGYRIYRSIYPDTNDLEAYYIGSVNDGNITNYTDNSASADDTNYYRIAAFDSHYTNGANFRNLSGYSVVLMVQPLGNKPPVLILPVNQITVLEDTSVFSVVFTNDNIKDSDANDTIGNIKLSAVDTDLVRIVIENNGTTQTAYFYLLADTFGIDTIVFQVKDSLNAIDTKIFVLTILNANDAPVIISAPIMTATQGTLYYYQIIAFDTDFQTINYQLSTVNCPSGMTISDTGSIYWTPNASQVGANTVSVLAGDGIDTAIQQFVITVSNVNDSPLLNLTIAAMTAYEDTPAFTYTINASNVSDSDAVDTIGTMTVTVLNNNLASASVTNNGIYHTITFTVKPDTFGVDAISIKITDSSGAFDVKQFILTILNVNDTPYFISQMNTVLTARIAYSFIQTAVDIDDTHLAITANTALPKNCSITAIGDTSARIDWLPANEGIETIALRVTDASGAYAVINYGVSIIDGPRKVQNIQVSYNADSSVKLNWDAPLFNNVSLYTINLTDTNGNIIYTANYDSSVKTCNIPQANFELDKDYKITITVTDKHGNISSETPAQAILNYKPNYRETTEFANDLSGKTIYLNPAGNNELLVPVLFPATNTNIDYSYIEYKPISSGQWNIADLNNNVNDKILPPNAAAQPQTDQISAGLWNLNSLNAGLYDIRIITVYKNGSVDTSASKMVEFTNSKDASERIEKYDTVKDTAFVQIKTAVGAETIIQIFSDVKTINNQRIQKNVVVIAPADLISSDSRQQIYGGQNGFDTLIIEKIQIEEAGDTITSDNRLASMSQWDFDAAIIRVQLLRYNYSETAPFDKPVTIEIPYFDEDNDGRLDNSVFVSENTLKAFYKQDASDTMWKEVPTTDGWSVTYDYVNNKATLKVKHFTIYALFGVKKAPAAANLNDVIVFPNPFRPNDGNPQTGTELWGTPDVNNAGGIHIKGLTADCSIEIYDILGRKITSLTNVAGGYGMAIWDACDDRGRKVGSGTYFIVIKGNGQTIVKKAAVIR